MNFIFSREEECILAAEKDMEVVVVVMAEDLHY